MYNVNYKTLLKEIKEETNKWKHIPCSGIGRLNIVRYQYYPKQPTDSMQSLENPEFCKLMTLFAEVEKPILKFTWNLKGPQIAKIILKKNKTENTHVLISKLPTKL